MIADYFLICTGNNERQIQAIVDEIIEQEEKADVKISRVEGKTGAKWVLIDLNDVIVHIFSPSERSFYNLEKLWSDAPIVSVNDWITD